MVEFLDASLADRAVMGPLRLDAVALLADAPVPTARVIAAHGLAPVPAAVVEWRSRVRGADHVVMKHDIGQHEQT
jgi:hypothetical protein